MSRFRLIEKRRKEAGIELDEAYINNKESIIKAYIDEFRNSNRQYKTMYDTNEIGEEMRRHIDRLIDEFEFILQQQKEMCSKAIKIYDHTQRKLKKAE